ncbi:MAG: type II toxin-antitoxin system RelE/ParE family toxin [Proteobacteria bacterium]|nr:type II toxin-antitoxin system RelE/ParE family toxin [Pseudomonadota bacterium]
MRIAYSAEAVADLVRLREFIAVHDPSAAARMAADLLERIDRLAAFPRMGRAIATEGAPDSLRDLIAGHYVVRYAVHGSLLVVLRVWHHNEDRPDIA